MARRKRADTPILSCRDCLSWGPSYGSRSYCRACYDFVRSYSPARCEGCGRLIAVKKGHCRLCWLQAGLATAGGRRLALEDFKSTGCWQLSLSGLNRLGNTGPAAATTAPAGPPTSPGWKQLELRAPGESRYFDARHWVASAITNDALALTRRIACDLAQTRGWNTRIVIETGRALAVVLADHIPGDLIAWSWLSPALHSRDLSVTRTTEILELAGLLDDDRIPSFTVLKQARLALLPAPMAADVDHWLRTRGQGGPRSRPRDEHTVRMNLNRVHPLLLQWADRDNYLHLREVTAADVTAATQHLPSTRRRQTLTALRSLFRHCKKTGRIFRDPTRDVRDGQRPLIIVQPLRPEQIDQATAAALTPSARLSLALAAVHAARPKTIRELHLDDVDLGNRRITIAGRTRPLDDLTRSLLLTWLQQRRHRWPDTANPHLILNQQTAMTTRAVSENWLTESSRGLTATLEALRVDRQLEEALTHHGDPLHLTAMFGICDDTAIRYATIARTLLETAAERHDPDDSHEPNDPNHP
jgi:hypothetical protein